MEEKAKLTIKEIEKSVKSTHDAIYKVLNIANLRDDYHAHVGAYPEGLSAYRILDTVKKFTQLNPLVQTEAMLKYMVLTAILEATYSNLGTSIEYATKQETSLLKLYQTYQTTYELDYANWSNDDYDSGRGPSRIYDGEKQRRVVEGFVNDITNHQFDTSYRYYHNNLEVAKKLRDYIVNYFNDELMQSILEMALTLNSLEAVKDYSPEASIAYDMQLNELASINRGIERAKQNTAYGTFIVNRVPEGYVNQEAKNMLDEFINELDEIKDSIFDINLDVYADTIQQQKINYQQEIEKIKGTYLEEEKQTQLKLMEANDRVQSEKEITEAVNQQLRRAQELNAKYQEKIQLAIKALQDNKAKIGKQQATIEHFQKEINALTESKKNLAQLLKEANEEINEHEIEYTKLGNAHKKLKAKLKQIENKSAGQMIKEGVSRLWNKK